MSESGYYELDITVPAQPCYLRQLRDLVRSFGLDCRAPEGRVVDMVLAANEACANVMQHAYGKGRGPLHLRGWRERDGLVFEISDNGTPVAEPVPGRVGGLGIPLIRELSEEVDIEGPGEYGTRLAIRFNL
jgi:anti-sigma regulatory factor (Ser/Thr protein kinase)